MKVVLLSIFFIHIGVKFEGLHKLGIASCAKKTRVKGPYEKSTDLFLDKHGRAGTSGSTRNMVYVDTHLTSPHLTSDVSPRSQQ